MINMQSKNILVVTPHPDDAESGAGGTIVKWSRQGAEISLVVCTNGDKGTSDRDILPHELAETRKEEQKKAAAILGISKVIFLEYPDQSLSDSNEFRKLLVREIRIHKPDVVMTIDPERKWIRHKDHYYTGRVALDAVFPYARDHLAYPDLLDEGLEPHKVLDVYLWGSDDPDTFVDIDDTFDSKMEALYCHASQMGRSKKEGSERWRARLSEHGQKIVAELAEPFKRLKLG